MKPLSWNEIRERATKFTQQWRGETRERAEAQTFWNELFLVFGRERRVVATFEHAVKSFDKHAFGFIDLFWKGKLLAEHKSAGKSLAKAESQAFDYIQRLIDDGKDFEVPRYVIVSDFATIVLHDLEKDSILTFSLENLRDHVHHFAFIAGYETIQVADEQTPANIKAAEIMAGLHDALIDGGYSSNNLDRFLTRVLFCLFAEDTGIFEPNTFSSFIEHRTAEDGSDLGPKLVEFFQTLNQPVAMRQRHLDEALPHVNGGLFDSPIELPAFNSAMRQTLVDCANFNWAKISPAIFGSIFQGVMDPPKRRQLGAHYTSERDIMKLIRGAFLDDLEAEFQQAIRLRSGKVKRLNQLHLKISNMKFIDPACGCGNFLIIAFRELRKLEQEILIELHTNSQGHVRLATDVRLLNLVSVEQFYGMELLPFPVEIARTGLWLMEHVMNMLLSDALGQYFVRLPLEGSPHIISANALRSDWRALLPPTDEVFIIGNPPFVGKKEQNSEQKNDMKRVWGDTKGYGVLDYVTCWHRRAVEYMAGTAIRCAFVSTNSITQGEQVATLWDWLHRHGVIVHFAHRTFAWTSEARGKAHVHVVIVGFGLRDAEKKTIHEYIDDAEAVSSARNISPYLVDGPNIYLYKRRRPLCPSPVLSFGNMPNDGGNLLLTEEEKIEFERQDPVAAKLLRPFIGPDELLHGINRWCLWLVGASPKQLKRDSIRARIQKVRKHRESSSRPTTRELASTPSLFGEIRQPSKTYLAVPKTGSERREYIPMVFLDSDQVVSTDIFTAPSAEIFHFGVLSSRLHAIWVLGIGGRMKSDPRYSATLIYNNFPWPKSVTPKQRLLVESCAGNVIDVRKIYPNSTLSELYDPDAMPASLAKAHSQLDRAVEQCYQRRKFRSDRERLEFLLTLHLAFSSDQHATS